MSPIGPLQLTAEECNEILMKRAAAAVAANNQQHTTINTNNEGHHSISVQVQKVIQGLEENDDSQNGPTITHCKIEPNLEITPKIEQMDEMEQSLNNSAQTKERPYACSKYLTHIFSLSHPKLMSLSILQLNVANHFC